MKRMIIIILLTYSVSFGGISGSGRGRYNSYKQILGNVKIISPADNVQSAYDTLKANTSMGTLSATNWRTLILNPGRYTVTTQITFDTDYIAIVGLLGDPRATMITGSIDGYSLIKQTADTLSLANISTYTTGTYSSGNGYGGLWIQGCDNTDSYYSNCFFDMENPSNPWMTAVAAVEQTNFSGTWENCRGSSYSFRITGRHNDGAVVVCDPIMRNCHSFDATGVDGTGVSSFCGDGIGPHSDSDPPDENEIGAIMQGTYISCTSGPQSFSGCIQFSAPIGSDAYFESCVSGYNSFGMRTTVAGTFINCTAGPSSFAGTHANASVAEFSGVARNCVITPSVVAGADDHNSFGAGSLSKCSGKLYNCIDEEAVHELRLEGAVIDNLRRKVSETNANCLELLDATSKVYNSTLLGNGSGNSISAASLTISSGANAPTGGTYTITVNDQTTGAINHDATDAEVETALEALGAITAIDVVGSEGAGTGLDTASNALTLDLSGDSIASTVTIFTVTDSTTGGDALTNTGPFAFVGAHNRMNLGLGDNVGNKVATSYDVIDSDVK